MLQTNQKNRNSEDNVKDSTATANRSLFLFAWLLTLFLMSSVQAAETTAFRILPGDSQGSMPCDYLTIKDGQAQCTTGGFLVTYSLSRIQAIDVTNGGRLRRFRTITEEAAEEINALTADKKNPSGDTAKPEASAGTQQLSFHSVSDFTGSLHNIFNDLIHGGPLGTALLISGFLLFLIGNVLFLIATFRAGIFWGLGCLFLPFISFIFLFVHWKTAAKPFLIILLGIALSFSATMFTPDSADFRSRLSITRRNSTSNSSRFQCRGKRYCSEMTSCAEAEFYLRNCPGTKMDGDNDGRPCEDQWCGH